MKKLLLVLLSFVLISSFSFAQDVIIKKNFDEIECVVLEVGIDIIKYKRYDNPDGPVYSIGKEDVATIKYKNGVKDVFNVQPSSDTINKKEPLTYNPGFWGLTIKKGSNKLSGFEVRNLYSNYEEALFKYNTGKTLHTIGSIISFPSAFVFGWELGTSINSDEINNLTLIVSGAGMVLGIVLAVIGENSIKKSIEIYNSEISKTAFSHLNFGVTKNGVGFCIFF